VDNSLDACEEAGIGPVVHIGIEQLGPTHFKVAIQDNGPGIVRQQIGNIFGKLLYGSKFHRLRMSRGQQGIGISAAGMYGLLTTGMPIKITSRTSARSPATYVELQIDTRQNRPDIIKQRQVEWDVPHGTRVEIELEAKYQRGRQSVDDYLRETAIANPHVTLVYNAPDGRTDRYESSAKHMPALPKAVRPHPHGVELGILMKMLAESKTKRCSQFLANEFSRVSPRVAAEILQRAGVDPAARPGSLGGDQAKAIYNAIAGTKIMAPAADCVVPIGKDQLIAGLKQVVQAEFYAATTRSPAVYRGNPFIIEAAIAYGKPEGTTGVPPVDQNAQSTPTGETPVVPSAADIDQDEDSQLAKLIRFANRVPLLYQQSACSIYKAVTSMNWRLYGLPQGRGALPEGPLTIIVHMASVWVPFTSESKEAIAAYPEIVKELRLALQECGRQLGTYVRKAVRMHQELKKRGYIEKYLPAIGEALRDILELKDKQVDKVCQNLKHVLEHSRKM
jgi:DNA topoisomerase-6 subunit B